MADHPCPTCEEEIGEVFDFWHLGKNVMCPCCNASLVIMYDEIYSGGDEVGWFYAVTKEQYDNDHGI